MAQEQTILPKGIVLNRNAVYEEIAKYDVMPVEQILRACHVFSTTSRELYDPTARRLENFWTRVLGGDRRYLPGRVIARLFKDISEETSFVKLRGPDNRYEPPSPGSEASKPRGAQATSLASASKPKPKPTTPSTKVPRPILKRPRGPSASGPRPTARFVSPPSSEIDEDSTKQGDATTSTPLTTHNTSAKDSGSSTTKEERTKGRSHRSKKKGTAFAASTPSRRRPGMPRRSSSQSSAGASDVASKEGGDSSLGSKYDGSQSSVPTILEKPEQQPASTKKGKGNTGMSAKAAGKRPMTQSRVSRTTSKPGAASSNQSRNEAPPAGEENTEVERQSSAQPGSEEKGAASTESHPKAFSSDAIQRSNTQQHPRSESSPLMNRSSSDAGTIRPISREASRTFVPPSSLMSSTPAKLDTSVIGQGTISGFAESIPTQSSSIGRFPESGGKEAYEKTSQTSGGTRLGQQLTPTQPSPTPTIPLARSKSQLSILLDRKVEGKKTKR
ncbi:hypothetical protein E0Z10_g5120 [Xylaria hypoxylon]|uniref:Uncharacterized protein n=1 Tax=Xylaria hypoxylon TaxID=37992 RepID=A0A4Z0Z246_9PEZI|nr:hypothetical protein E0Z10_g5120 [Xylaria hypoxylon]